MGKTLVTILTGLILGAAVSSCTPEGRSLALSLMTHAAREGISHELNPHETNVNVYNQQQNQERLPENVIKVGKGYQPAPGYTWVNLDNQQDLRVKKVPNWDEYRIKNERIGNWIAPPPSFAFLDWEDDNRDGYLGGDELKGLGNYFKFKEGEEKLVIHCGSTWEGVKGKRAMIKIKETNPEKIIGISELPVFTVDNKTEIRSLNLTKGIDTEGIKEYTVEWYIDGRNIPTRTINIFVDYGKKEEAEGKK